MNLTIKECLFFSILAIITLQQQCHYSCNECVAPYYTHCKFCTDSSIQIKTVEDPAKFDPNGLCTGIVPTGTEGLGIILLILSIAGLLITQSFQAFFIISTMQTFALFALLEVAWIGIGSFVLHSFQYFMPVNLMVDHSDNQDKRLLQYGFYRLNQYINISNNNGLIAIFAIDSVLFLTIILIFVFTFLRKDPKKDNNQSNFKDQSVEIQRRQKLNHLIPQNSGQSQRFQQNQNIPQMPEDSNRQQRNQEPGRRGPLMEIICEKLEQCFILRKLLHIVIYLFFFLVQETALSIMVRAVFKIQTFDIIIWIIYFIQVVTVLIISFYELQVDRKLNPRQRKTHQFGLSLFLSRQCMFLVILKKIILPLGVVLSPNLQYIFFIFYLVLFLIEGTLDSRSKRMACISRLGLWKLFQMLITTLILSFYLNEKKGTSEQNSNIINTVLSILLVVFLVSLVVEFVVSFIALLNGSGRNNQVQNESVNGVQNRKMIQLNNTQLTLNQDEAANQNIFQHIQMTRENTNQLHQDLQNSDQLQLQTQFKNPIVIQSIQNISNQPFDSQQHNELVLSKTRVKERALGQAQEQQQQRINKQMTDKSNSTKIDRSQLEDKLNKSNNPKIQPQFNQEDQPEKTNFETADKDEENPQKKKPKKQIMNAQLRKIYGIK